VPTPARTSISEIVEAGRSILEAGGIDGLTMQRVATAVGVRGPSLYKRVPSRNQLIRLIGTDAARELAAALDAAATTGDPRRDLRALAHAFRAFGRANPETYGLLFGRLPADARIDPELILVASRAVLRVAGELAGEARALEAARTVVAWAHGFVNMDLAGAFRLGGDVEMAFDYGIEALVRAIGEPEPSEAPHEPERGRVSRASRTRRGSRRSPRGGA
jgi:AcrR family transcriptional regulator